MTKVTNGHLPDDTDTSLPKAPKDPALWKRLLEEAEHESELRGKPIAYRGDLFAERLCDDDCRLTDLLSELAVQLEGAVARARSARTILAGAVAAGVLEGAEMDKAEERIQRMLGHQYLIDEIENWFERYALSEDGTHYLDDYRADLMTEWPLYFARRLEIVHECDVKLAKEEAAAENARQELDRKIEALQQRIQAMLDTESVRHTNGHADAAGGAQ